MQKTLTSLQLNAISYELVALGEIDQGVSIEVIQSHANLYSDIQVVRATTKTGTGRVFYVKMPHVGSGQENIVIQRLQREFEILTRLHNELQKEDNLNVVRPVAVLADPCAVITEEAVGENLAQVVSDHGRTLVSGKLSFDQTEQAFENAGLWLKHFQYSDNVEILPFNEMEFRDSCRLRIELLATANAKFANELAQPVKNFLDQILLEMQGRPVRQVPVHGDFAPHNIIANSSRIWLLDFSMVGSGPAEFDFCTFDMALVQMTYDLRFSARKILAMRNAFRHGYGRSPDIESVSYRMRHLQLLLNRMLLLVNKGNSSEGRVIDLVKSLRDKRLYGRYRKVLSGYLEQ